MDPLTWPMSTKIQTQRDSFCFRVVYCCCWRRRCLPGFLLLFSFCSLFSFLLSLLVCLFCIAPLCYTYSYCLCSCLFFISCLGHLLDDGCCLLLLLLFIYTHVPSCAINQLLLLTLSVLAYRIHIESSKTSMWMFPKIVVHPNHPFE